MKLLTFQARRFAWKAFSKTLEDADAEVVQGESLETVVVFVHAQATDEDEERRGRTFKHTLKHIKWLASELPKLVDDGVISSDAADKLREHYGEVDPNSGRRIALTICSILGSLLIGAGIILLLAHNWRELSRSTRTILSIAPLAISQILALWVLWSGRDSAAWREGVATFLTLSIGASISLVAQTYHIHGDLGSFLLTWSVLSLPLVYLMNASFPAIIYLVGITSWSGYEQSSAEHAVMFWPLQWCRANWIYRVHWRQAGRSVSQLQRHRGM